MCLSAGIIVERSIDIILDNLRVAYTDQEAVHLRYNTTFSIVTVSRVLVLRGRPCTGC